MLFFFTILTLFWVVFTQPHAITTNCDPECGGASLCINGQCRTSCSIAGNKQLYKNENNTILEVCPIGESKCHGCCPNFWKEGCEPCCSNMSEAALEWKKGGIWLGISGAVLCFYIICIISILLGAKCIDCIRDSCSHSSPSSKDYQPIK